MVLVSERSYENPKEVSLRLHRVVRLRYPEVTVGNVLLEICVSYSYRAREHARKPAFELTPREREHEESLESQKQRLGQDKVLFFVGKGKRRSCVPCN